MSVPDGDDQPVGPESGRPRADLGQIPMPAAVAARPRDDRGYPALAITPWIDGEPRFAATGTARTYICAVERRCSICGTVMAPGPVWRVVAEAETEAIEAALEAGRPYLNRAPTAEAPGHLACMLYACVVCPYLSRPTARRGEDAEVAGQVMNRGDRRGVGGAVAGFDEYEFRMIENAVWFRFSGLCDFRPHRDGREHLDDLRELVAGEHPPTGRDGLVTPDYLMADEESAQRHFAFISSASPSN